MICDNCKNEIQENWKACPNCGASINNGKSKKPKKPFYKKIWFWIIVVIAGLFLMGGYSGDSSSADDNRNEESTSDIDDNTKYLGILGQDCSLDDLTEQVIDSKFDMIAVYWGQRNDDYNYIFNYYALTEEGTRISATFFVKDSTDEQILSDLQSFSYEDEIVVNMTGYLEDYETGSQQIFRYVNIESAQILDSDSKEAQSITHNYLYVGDSVQFQSGLKYTIIDTGFYTDSYGDNYAYVEIDITNLGEDTASVAFTDLKFYGDGYAMMVGSPIGQTSEILKLNTQLSSGKSVRGRCFAECENPNAYTVIEAELGDATIVVKDDRLDSVEVDTGSIVDNFAENTNFTGRLGTYCAETYQEIPGRIDLTQDEQGTIYVAVGSMDYQLDAGYFGTYACRM